MKPIKLEICCGTTCYLLGAAKLLNIEKMLPTEWRELVEVNALPCLDLCVSEDLCGAPYVKLNGEVIRQATVEKIFEKLRSLIKE